jgi:hypothetical protein
VGWGAPWLAPYREIGERIEQHLLRDATVAEALNAEAGAEVTVRFVPQDALPRGEAYESFVRRTGRVPTRDNLHDLFNGLVWLRWPRLKAQLNALQSAQIAQDGIGATRGAVRDAVTVFDENGALLKAPAALLDALRQRDWRRLFVEERALWREAELVLVGHALLEKLSQPRKPITAHLLTSVEALAQQPFLPLPVLGVPGWWPENESPAFYDDASVFRPLPAGSRRSTGSARRCRS